MNELTKERPRLVLQFGAMCEPISKQLENLLGPFGLSKKDGKRFDHISDSITMLAVHGIIPDSVVRSARKKLMAKIVKQVRQ